MANLSQLESARTLALGDGRYYPAILPGVLPLIRVNAQTSTFDVQRWGAEFLAETFASPTWPSDAKETSSLTVLDILNEYLKVDDVGIVKSAIQAASTIYPLVYRHTYVTLPIPHIDL
jgi:symplekin